MRVSGILSALTLEHYGGNQRGNVLPENSGGVCGQKLFKTLTLFKIKIYDFPYSVYDLTKIRYPM